MGVGRVVGGGKKRSDVVEGSRKRYGKLANISNNGYHLLSAYLCQALSKSTFYTFSLKLH